jgi:hypothetical protein
MTLIFNTHYNIFLYNTLFYNTIQHFFTFMHLNNQNIAFVGVQIIHTIV